MKSFFSTLPAASFLVLSALSVAADDWPQWRGPQRNGISQEAGLLQEWSKDQPKLLWKIENAGSGYAAPSVVGDYLYVLGNEGSENEFVQALTVKEGKRLWSTRLGKVGNPGQQPNFPGARSTPTVEGDVLYALGSDGDLACLELSTGKLRWHANLRTDFGGKPGEWAYAESPLVHHDAVICTPGGASATLVALNKRSGEVLWKCAMPEGDEAGYASPIIVETGGLQQVVQLVQKGLIGVDAQNGKFLWRYGKAVSRYGANIPTPLASEGFIYTASAGTGGGTIKLKVKDGVVEPEQIYFESKLPTAIGSAVKVGEYLYGTTGQALLCVSFATGQIKWEDRSIGTSSLCYAGGRLYLHGENGDVALVDPTSEAYREKGRFTPPGQPKRGNEMEKAWAYPVVANGRLYVRDHGALWCYDARAVKQAAAR